MPFGSDAVMAGRRWVCVGAVGLCGSCVLVKRVRQSDPAVQALKHGEPGLPGNVGRLKSVVWGCCFSLETSFSSFSSLEAQESMLLKDPRWTGF